MTPTEMFDMYFLHKVVLNKRLLYCFKTRL